MKAFVATFAAGFALANAASGFAAEDELMKEAQSLFSPIPLEPQQIGGKPATPAEVELGKMLYFDPRLSQSHNISCNTCHQIGLGGDDDLRPRSVTSRRRAPGTHPRC
jgi:cytochrome c peroxidase